MESLNIKTFLLYAIYIVRTNPVILIVLVLIGVFNGAGVFLPEGSLSNLIKSFTLIATIFISPVIYGVYYETIEDKYSSVANIFRTYVAGYLLLLFCMYIPIIMTTAMVTSASGSEGNTGYVMLTILLFSLLFIYVVPCYYISGTIIKSISYGVQFFLKNLFASAPLLVLALMSELLLLVSQFKMEWLKQQSLILFVVLDFSVYIVASIIDFLLFIIIIYILRSQDLPKREGR